VSDKLIRLIEERNKPLLQARQLMEPTWQLIAQYMIPRRASFTERDPVTNLQRERLVLDSTAPRALEMFASFLHTSLSPPTSLWFDLVVRGQNPLDANRDVVLQQWVERVRKAVSVAMVTGPTNVYSALHELYLDLGAFGTGCMFIDWKDGLRFHTFHLASIVLGQNEAEEIDYLCRDVTMTVLQMRERWPDKSLGRGADRTPDDAAATTKVRVLHVVFPATDRGLVDLIAAPLPSMPYYSVWINAEDRHVIDYGWFSTKPFVAPRWYRTRQEIYGRSPAMTVLGDTIMCNRMAATVLRGAEKLVDPPMLVPDGGLISPLRAFPGGITYSDGTIQIQPLLPPGASRIELGDALIEKRQQAIREGFFVPLFVSPDSPVKTATQVLQEADERNRITAPMITRLHHELFSPLVLRVLDVLAQAGRLPEPPASRAGVELDVEFISPVISAQRMTEGMALLRLFEAVAPWYQIDRGAFDWLDTDAAVRVLHAATGAPASVLNSPAAVDRLRKARQEMEIAAQQQQQALQAVEVGAKLQAAQK
jgi:hypothetical protein